ncbi:MAG: D-glycero-alpha-D-manno-heptose-1,7-bisphosphate 7-phosphatase [Gammaproteobacteria bacterium]
MSAALFIDQDGTLIENLPFNVDPARMRLTAGMPELLAHVAASGLKLVVVCNQGGAARGLFSERALGAVGDRLGALVADAGGRLDACYFCPHLPDGEVATLAIDCACRKPRPGLLLRAAHELGLDLADSWMLGDILDDVEAGHRAGCRSLLFDIGHETEWRAGRWRMPDGVVRAPREVIPWLHASRDAERRS